MADTWRSLKPVLAFHPLTRFFDAFNNLFGYGPSLMRRVLAVADVKSDERLLDVGSGTGTLLRELKRAQPTVRAVGIEPDPQAREIAREKLAKEGHQVEFVQGVAQELPFPDASVDVVISTLMFHHLSTRAKQEAIKEVHRVLKAGGRFVLVDFGKPRGVLDSVLLTIGSLFDGRENLEANLQGRLPSLLQEAGFQAAEVAPPFRSVRFLVAGKRAA